MLLFVALITACATSITGRHQLMIVSEDSAIAASKIAYTEMLKPYAEKGDIDNDPALKNRVYKITGRLIAQAIKIRPETKNWDWSIKTRLTVSLGSPTLTASSSSLIRLINT